MERRFEYQQPIMIVKDNEIQGNRRRSERIQGNVGGGIKREHYNTDQKRINQMVQPVIHEKESKQEKEKDTGCENTEQIDCRLPLQNARLERGETNNQTWRLGHFTSPLLRISPPNSSDGITTIPSIRIPEQLLHIQSNAIRNQTLANILCNSNGTDNATNMNENRNWNNQLCRRHPSSPQEQGIFKERDSEEKSETEPNQTVIFLGWEWNLANATVKTKPKKRLVLLHDLYNMRRWIKTGTEITVKANIPSQLIKISPQMTITTDAAPSVWGSTLEKELEMIAMAHGTWNKRQAKLSSNNRENKAITNGLRSFAKTLKNLQVQSLAIRSVNSTTVFDNRKRRASISLIIEIKQVHQTIEKLGIQIQFTHLPGVRNEIADALSRLSRAGDYKLKEKIFKQICLQMNLNPKIDLFSQHFNNLLPRFMSTIRGHGETAIDALNQTWKMELPWIHLPIPLLPAVPKKI
ncbi:MAG: hypothetical protein EZS28_009317 [Streblomastix strix]|uniref:RNase H type-1 domain-containing protein n=1 Tax=Streblomastix strix TaxID=222440 RepID=A0A5J4WLF7_9EUKA|nr:MAG: hypothetical protein EZS28_009317 [Streblomastix strix]